MWRPFDTAYNRAASMEALLLDGIMDETVRQWLLGRLRAAESVAAGVYGGSRPGVDLRVRKARALQVDDAIRVAVTKMLDAARPRISSHFGVALERAEEPQFLQYGRGDFFVAHQDGNTGLTRDDSQHRRISAVIFLNATSAEPQDGSYGGGELLLHGKYPDWQSRYVVPASPGTLVAFRSETTHEVAPVTHGHRYTIVSWYR